MNKNGTGVDDFDGDDLRDPALRRALDHAPDRDALPAAHTRDAILKMAHNLAAQPAVASGASAASASATRATNSANTANTASALPWWRRLFGGGGEPRSRMPWNAAFATVLVAAFVTVLWRSEPVSEARLDGEARVGGASAPAAEAPPVPPVPPVPSAATAPDAARDAASPPSVAAQQAPAGAAPQPAAPAPSTAPAPAPAPAQQAAAPSADQRARVQRESSSAKESARAQALPKQAAPAQAAPPPPVVAEQSAPAPAQDERREERAENERRRAYASAAPAAPAPSASPAAPALRAAPPARQSPDAAALASRGDAQADVSGALREASPGARAKAAPSREAAPSFSALERWTSFSASAGDARRARSDVEGLPALLGAVARSATAADAALDAPVEARLAFYRGNVLVAVLEIAGNQVRWTPQPGGTAWVGTPPAQALDALRSALAR